jgi:hypothetical protein
MVLDSPVLEDSIENVSNAVKGLKCTLPITKNVFHADVERG